MVAEWKERAMDRHANVLLIDNLINLLFLKLKFDFRILVMSTLSHFKELN